MKMLLPAALLAMSASAAETLEDLRWKMRLLVVTGAAGKETREKLTTSKDGLSERDLRLIFVSDPGIDPALAKQLRERLRIRPGTGEVLLLGKDGRTTLRWKAGDFTTADLFAKIDAMPMRKSEMRGD